MTILFSLKADTIFGQDMYLVIDGVEYPMTYSATGLWVYEYVGKVKARTRYRYFLRDTDGSMHSDTPKYRPLPSTKSDFLTVEDEYSFRSVATVFESKVFTECIMRQENARSLPSVADGENLILVHAPGVLSGQRVAIVGECALLGEWDAGRAVPLKPSHHGMWWLKVSKDNYLTHTAYKYIVVDSDTGAVVKWETGDNRRMPVLNGNKIVSTTIRIDYDWHGTGVAIPVFSLRSAEDWGVGEFTDLKYMARWAKAKGASMLQILPVNDTTATRTDLDSYPYRSNSVYALNPIYINAVQAGILKDKKLQAKYLSEGARLNSLDKVDWSAVYDLKINYLYELYEQEYESLAEDKVFKRFVKTNLYWLRDYAVFSCLREQYHTDDFMQWGDYSVYSEKKVVDYGKKKVKEVYFYYFVQYHLDKQLKAAIAGVHDLGLAVKGDLPIGIGAHSVDAWVQPQLFNLDMQAGAPPDDFSVTGQNWGFPTYNWMRMAETDYRWWKQRFGWMDSYFDAFRIDHILGFFRIWEIPMTAVWGLLGHFAPAQPLSVQEIESYGIGFDKKRLTTPHLTRQLLDSLFGDKLDRVVAEYMNQVAVDEFEFKASFDTQRKLTDCFVANGMMESHKDIYDALMPLYCNVLMIEDEKLSGHYHPRISLYQTESYASLDAHCRWVLRQIHDNFFYYRHDDLWRREAMRKLPALLNVTDMMVCGEDLGMVPACVPEVMERLKILSLEVERMPKKAGDTFVNLDAVPYLSVVCTGTHDTSTLRQWWMEDRELIREYYNRVLGHQGEAPKELTARLASQIVDREIKCPSMWTILPWQDYMACDERNRQSDADDERINVPSNPQHVWRWRMPISL